MSEDHDEVVKTDQVVASIRAELEKASPSRRQRILEAITLAALGSIPWVGGVLAAAATFKFDESGIRGDELRNQGGIVFFLNRPEALLLSSFLVAECEHISWP